MQRQWIRLSFLVLGLAACGAPRQEQTSETYASEDTVAQAFGDHKAGKAHEEQLAPASAEDLGIVPFDRLVTAEELASAKQASYAATQEAPEVTNVDLRSYDSPVKYQGGRGTCTAFATVGAMEHLAKRATGTTYDLSEEHLWSLYGEPYTYKALAAATTEFLVSESVWPYNGEATTAELDAKGLVKMKTAKPDVTSVSAVNSALLAGHPLVISVKVTTALTGVGSDGVVEPKADNTDGGHAMLVVGIKKDTETADYTGGGYYIVKNSWSKSRGDKGYIYLPFSYCDSDTYCLFREVPGVETRTPSEG